MQESNSECTSHDKMWFASNEANWDDRARTHMYGNYYGVNNLIQDPNAISDILSLDIDRFDGIAGKDVIHLQCHVGTDTIGFSRLGAKRVVGLDLSEVSLQYARDIAMQAGVTVEYVHANVYDAPACVQGTFDIVYTSVGVLCWLPDIDRWAQVVAALLKEDGVFVVRDIHPMFQAVGDDVSQGLQLEYAYFQQDEPDEWDGEETYVQVPGAPKIEHTKNYSWNHGLGEIISALIRAGLVIDEVDETEYSNWRPWPEIMEQSTDGRWRLKDRPERLPMEFVIRAHKA